MYSDQALRLHIAKWVVPVDRPPIEYGGLVTFGGKIVDVARATSIRSRYLGEIIDHGEAIITPVLINAHSHLELSPLRNLVPSSGSFVTWVRRLITARERIDHREALAAIEAAAIELVEDGTGVLADTGNTGLVPDLAGASSTYWPFSGIFFHEVIAPKGDDLVGLQRLLNSALGIAGNGSPHNDFNFALSAHSLYSVTPDALKLIKAWNHHNGLPFSIHVAESSEEIDFLYSGSGPIRELIEERGHWPLDYEIPRTTPVRYLDRLGLLDSRTICVHCVHLDPADIEILVRSHASVCLCPKSNMHIGVGFPKAFDLKRVGVNMALGTDSYASNDRLSIFEEMAALAATDPRLSTEAIFEAATLGGARAIGLDMMYGTLERGKKAAFLVVQPGKLSSSEIMDFLVLDTARKQAARAMIVEEGDDGRF